MHQVSPLLAALSMDLSQTIAVEWELGKFFAADDQGEHCIFTRPEGSAEDAGQIEIVGGRLPRRAIVSMQEVPVPDTGRHKADVAVGMAERQDMIWLSGVRGDNATAGAALWQRNGWEGAPDCPGRILIRVMDA